MNDEKNIQHNNSNFKNAFKGKVLASAVVLAGGDSRRMGRCKALIRGRDGKPLIQVIIESIRPFFSEIIISTNTPQLFSFLNLEMIPDRERGRGPLQGILTCLEAANSDRVFFIACDIPCCDIATMRKLLQLAVGRSGAVPKTPSGHFEPTFAVYTKAAIPIFKKILERGENRIRRAFDHGNFVFLDLPNDDTILDLNHPVDYERWRAS